MASADRVNPPVLPRRLSVADRLDTLVGIFLIGQAPTGDKDPFALRRAALGALRIIIEGELSLDLRKLVKSTADGYTQFPDAAGVVDDVMEFILERLKAYFLDKGIPVDVFLAVQARQPAEPHDFAKRIYAVDAFRKLPEAASLATANKRIQNILKQARDDVPAKVDDSLFAADAEWNLAAKTLGLSPRVRDLLKKRDYTTAMTSLAGLRESVDEFFDNVKVMDDDESLRKNRLALLQSISNLKRRTLLAALGASATAGWYFWPEDGLVNPCLGATLPANSAANDIITAAWDGIDGHNFWDCHVHLLGLGDSGGGAWVNPDMRKLSHPILFAQFKFFLNAACVEDNGRVDNDFVTRLLDNLAGLAPGARLNILAFDHAYDADGRQQLKGSHFHVPNGYASAVARRHPGKLEWTASIHPYREDAVPALQQAVRDGARAVKWLPPSMNIDPASPRCDAFYDALARIGVPLLSHAGFERAVHVPAAQALGNPLRLRRALDHGVRVIVAHCASMGDGEDLDAGAGARRLTNFELFARLMSEPRYEKLLYGDVSAMTQLNRIGPALNSVLERDDWHPRLINGSDYPLPGVFPLFSMKTMADRGYIDDRQAETIRAIRPHNPLLFDFVLKRTIRYQGKGFSPSVFETRRVFET